MKRMYIAPECNCVALQTELLIATSTGIGGSTSGPIGTNRKELSPFYEEEEDQRNSYMQV